METKLEQLLESYFDIHSDPTYEAWKQELKEEIKKRDKNSDPTYEAWKLV